LRLITDNSKNNMGNRKMKSKKTYATAEIAAMIALALDAGRRPLPELDPNDEIFIYMPIEELLTPPHDSLGAAAAFERPAGCGKHPITIRLPKTLIRAFKAKAARLGIGYQTLMARELKAAAYHFV
jgi:predicted DNA binding CopG/RHH family protein